MFRAFSFDAPSRQSSSGFVDNSGDISPSSSPSPPSDSIDELSRIAQQFDQQRLEPGRSYWNESYCEVASEPVANDSSMDSSATSLPAKRLTSSLSIRARRQLNARLQCNPVHIDMISSLVEKMVQQGEQCAIRPSNITEPVNLEKDSEDDSGVECDPQTPRISDLTSRRVKFKYRRSGDLREGSVRSLKSIRQRKCRSSKQNGNAT